MNAICSLNTSSLRLKPHGCKTFENMPTTVTVYDVLGRAMKVTLADNTETKTEYSTDGDSSYITNLDREIAQHIEYVPLASVTHADFQFGEVFIDELEPWRKSASEGQANCNNTLAIYRNVLLYNSAAINSSAYEFRCFTLYRIGRERNDSFYN